LLVRASIGEILELEIVRDALGSEV
jgi:hypothetical protein